MNAPEGPFPRLLVLTDASQTGERSLLDTIRLAIDGGARAVVIREKGSSPPERRALARAVRQAMQEVGGLVLVASDLTIEADGVHLASTDPFPHDDRPALVGRSCHGLADVLRAAGEGCDYVTVSPVFETASKPGYGPALGLAGLRDIVDDFEMGTDETPAALVRPHGRAMPIYALGGVDVELAGVCLRAGATGVAVMGGVMRAADPSATVHALVHAVKDCACVGGSALPPRRPFDDTLDVASHQLRNQSRSWQLGEVGP